jgi:hypothetical protein
MLILKDHFLTGKIFAYHVYLTYGEFLLLDFPELVKVCLMSLNTGIY